MAPPSKPSTKRQQAPAGANESYPIGTTVTITGLSQQAELNGMQAVVLDFDRGRHKVAQYPSPHPGPNPSPYPEPYPKPRCGSLTVERSFG